MSAQRWRGWFLRSFMLLALFTSPTVAASEFWYDTVPQELRFTFDQNVSATVGPEDHFLTNLTSGQQIDQSLITRSGYNTSTNTASFQVDPGKFDNGNYEDILLAPQ